MPVRAHRDSLGYRARKFVRRHTAAVAAGAAVAVALLTSSIVTWTFYRQAAQERERAEARFTDVRQLAHFVVFEFDRLLEKGITPARQALILRATDYLRRLEQDASADATLQREIASGYLKIGDLYGNLYAANLGDRDAARESYERALKIIGSAGGDDVVIRAEALMKIADLLMQAGSPRAAIESYDQARQALEKIRNPAPQAIRNHVDVLQKLGNAHATIGEYQRSLDLFEELQRRAAAAPNANEMMPRIAMAERRAGEMIARLGRIDEGLPRMLRSLEYYEDRAAATPGVPTAQRHVATSSTLIGDILVLAKRYPEAVVRFRKSLSVTEKLAALDPNNEQYQRDLSMYRARLADAVAHTGAMEEAEALTRRALRELMPLVKKGAQTDLYQYAWLLLTTPCKELRDPATALQYAERLHQMTNGQDPRMLDLVARATAALGSPARAVEYELRALQMLPSDTTSDLKQEIETNLADFRNQAEKRTRVR
jgi:tetratricopeptide (TPR) repeat protein